MRDAMIQRKIWKSVSSCCMERKWLQWSLIHQVRTREELKNENVSYLTEGLAAGPKPLEKSLWIDRDTTQFNSSNPSLQIPPGRAWPKLLHRPKLPCIWPLQLASKWRAKIKSSSQLACTKVNVRNHLGKSS